MSDNLRVKQIASHLCHGVHVYRFEYSSATLGGTTTRFHTVVPANASSVPILYYLSGMTDDDQVAVTSGEVAAAVAKYPIVVVLPDTSPRGAGAPGEDDDPEFGTGAGFYINATRPGFEAYQMATFVRDELPKAVVEALGNAVNIKKVGITGHSMGGSGALTLALRNPGLYLSVSALAPATNPSIIEKGIRIFTGYIGEDGWDEWDATELVRAGAKLPDGTLIDQGCLDEFLDQLKPHEFKKVCDEAGLNVELNMREGYDHGYFFVATFMEDHIAHHANALL